MKSAINLLSLKSVGEIHSPRHSKGIGKEMQQIQNMFSKQSETLGIGSCNPEQTKNRIFDSRLLYHKKFGKLKDIIVKKRNVLGSGPNVEKKQIKKNVSVRNLELIRCNNSESVMKIKKQNYLRKASKSTKILKREQFIENPRQNSTMFLLKKLEESIHHRKYSRSSVKVGIEQSSKKTKTEQSQPSKLMEMQIKPWHRRKVKSLKRTLFDQKLPENNLPKKSQKQKVLNSLHKIICKPLPQKTSYKLEPWRSVDVQSNYF